MLSPSPNAAPHSLHAIQGHPTGWRRYIYSTNHKDIGTMYLVFAITSGFVGGLLSLGMRLELAQPGMPRRIADYPDAFAGWNFISSLGSYLFAAGLIIFVVNMCLAFVRKQQAADNPWGEGATTLEWTLPSPPPFHQFDKLPLIR